MKVKNVQLKYINTNDMIIFYIYVISHNMNPLVKNYTDILAYAFLLVGVFFKSKLNFANYTAAYFVSRNHLYDEETEFLNYIENTNQKNMVYSQENLQKNLKLMFTVHFIVTFIIYLINFNYFVAEDMAKEEEEEKKAKENDKDKDLKLKSGKKGKKRENNKKKV
ncbi:hypothetical protein U3516DRAFT_803885 [Neocallimastix sp. 'constans']